MRRLILLFVGAATIAGCEQLNEDNEEYEEAVALVEQFSVDTVANHQATVTVRCFSPNPCWLFSRVSELRESTGVLLTVHRKIKKYQTCPDVVSGFSHTFAVALPPAGPYTIRIYRTPTTSLDTTLTY